MLKVFCIFMQVDKQVVLQVRHRVPDPSAEQHAIYVDDDALGGSDS